MNSEQLTKLWLNSVANSHSDSLQTRQNYKDILPRYCQFIGMNPEQIVADYENAEISGIPERVIRRRHSQKIQLWIEELKRNGCVPSTIRTTAAIVLSFYSYNDLPLGKVLLPKLLITYHNRDINKDEIQKILALVPLRERAIMATITQSGLRPVTVSKLLVKNVEKILETNTPIPCKINVTRDIEKGKLGDGHPSFIAEDAVKYVKQYLTTRSHLTPDSYLFATYQTPEKSMIPKDFSRTFRQAARSLLKSGSINFQIRENKPSELRLYCLRKYFRKYANQMGFEHVSYLMNHSTNGSDGHYVPKDPEFYRELYKTKAMPFLRLDVPTPTETDEILTTLKTQHEREIKEIKNHYQTENQDLRREVDELKKSLEPFAKLMLQLKSDDVMEFLIRKQTERDKAIAEQADSTDNLPNA